VAERSVLEFLLPEFVLCGETLSLPLLLSLSTAPGFAGEVKLIELLRVLIQMFQDRNGTVVRAWHLAIALLPRWLRAPKGARSLTRPISHNDEERMDRPP
jgi:hypothetical protein